MKKAFSIKKRQAQQLVEFAIVVPILMILIFIIVEFGAAINARVTLAEGVKMSLMEVNKFSNIDGDTATKEFKIRSYMKNKIAEYLISHNVPNSGSVYVSVNFNAINNTAIAAVSYQYHPYFLISGLLGSSVSTIQFSSSQTINPNIFKPNVFPASTRTSAQLSNYFTDGTGTFIESGALIDTTAFNYDDNVFNVREHIAFLVRLYEGAGTDPYLEYANAHARLVDWLGNDLLPPNLRINLRNATLEVRTPYYQSGAWFDTNIPYVWVASALGFNHIIYVKYNSSLTYMPHNSTLYYKLRFNNPADFYNRRIMFCGTGGASGNCNGDQRNTATVNERALRMNPLLGPDYDDNAYIIGTMEPISIDIVANPTYADFLHVKGFYYSYTEDYDSWDSSTWDLQYFMSIASPRVMTMADAIYHTDMTSTANNPFYVPLRYRFKLYEHDQGANAGEYDSSQAASVNAPNGGDTDRDIIASANDHYQVDIIDVYIDSDGDGIPDAWDRDPEYFDVNINNVIDGNEAGVDFWTGTRCRGGVDAGPGMNLLCLVFQDNISTPLILPATLSLYDITGGFPFYVATPYNITTSALEPFREARYLPRFKAADYHTFNDGVGHEAIYHNINGVNYSRKVPTWWDIGDSAAAFDTRRRLKAEGIATPPLIHGYLDGGMGNIDNILLSPSIELDYLLTSDTFSNNSYITRTPSGW